MFGHLTEQVGDVRFNNSYNPLPLEQRSPELAKVFKYIEGGAFGDGHTYDALLKTVSSHLMIDSADTRYTTGLRA
jgi:starch phosphorylase